MTKTAVKPSLRALLRHLIDYAGLFPPAKLDMPQTVRNYAAYLAADDAWMLGRLIVPAARLDEFEQAAADLLPADIEDDADTQPWTVSALTAAAGERQLAADLQRIQRFNDRHVSPAEGLAVIDAIELKADSAAAIDRALDLISDELFPFFEIPIADDPRGLLAAMAGSEAGAKVRTGGVSAEMYPRPAHLARFIAACADADVPFKATAGMHHPLWHHSQQVEANEFGFLTVFTAACLARRHDLRESEVAELLTLEAPDGIDIADDRIAWRGAAVEAAEIEAIREEFAVSFGSCSFDEPREDLRAMGLL